MCGGGRRKMFRKKYKHDKDKLSDACGIDKDKVLEKIEKVQKILSEMDGVKPSEIVEIYEKVFTKRELAYILYSLHEMFMITHIMSKLEKNFNQELWNIYA